MTFVSNELRVDRAAEFKNSAASYYTLISNLTTSEPINTERTKRELIGKAVFGKAIDASDVYLCIPKSIWKPDTVYDSYSDYEYIEEANFHITVTPTMNTTGDYRIYKCLENNGGATSLVTPEYDITNVTQIYTMSDGYVWKYMYTISATEYDSIASSEYIPVFDDQSVTPITGSTIDFISVSNSEENNGYAIVNGKVSQILTTTISVTPSTTMSQFTGFYNGQVLYVTDENSVSKLYDISAFSYSTSTGIYSITPTGKDAFITTKCTFSILPKIRITGDGTGAVAIPVIYDGKISKITVLATGSGYTNAIATVVNPLYEFAGTTATLIPILSPTGGHGSDISAELRASTVMIYVKVSNANNLIVPTSNTISAISVVKDQSFKTTAPDAFDNRLNLNMVSVGSLAVGDTVTQKDITGITTFSGKVHEISGTDLYLSDFNGPYINPTSGQLYSDTPIDPSKFLITPGNVNLVINSINAPIYVQRSGTVLYGSTFDPITRTVSSNEEFKIILEF